MPALHTSLHNAFVSSIVENILVYPIDCYKIMKQRYNTSLVDFILSPLSEKYRGFYYRTCGSVPTRIVFWTSQDYFGTTVSSQLPPTVKYAIVGAITGFNQTILDCPVENMKIARISQHAVQYTPQFLYKGFQCNLLRNQIFAASVYSFTQTGNKHGVNPFISGAVGGFLGCVTSQPLDYLKTLRQSNCPVRLQDLWLDADLRTRCMQAWKPRATFGFLSMGIGSTVISLLTQTTK